MITPIQVSSPSVAAPLATMVSSKPIIRGRKFVIGVRSDRHPILNVPPGQHRLRMQNDSMAMLFVRTVDGIGKYVLEDHGEHWAGVAVAMNTRVMVKIRE